MLLPQALELQGPPYTKRRNLRILSRTNASLHRIGTSLSDCVLINHPWSGDPSLDWPAVQVPHALRNGTKYVPRSTLLSQNLIGSAASPQIPPVGTLAGQNSNYTKWSHLAPPTRSAEPYTIETWVLVMQPQNAGTYLYGNTMKAWSRTGAPEEEQDDRENVHPGTASTTAHSSRRTSMNLKVEQADVDAPSFHGVGMRQITTTHEIDSSTPAAFCAKVTLLDCPRRIFDPDCTPMDVPVPLNDTCR